MKAAIPALFSVLLLAGPSFAAELGDPAPALQVAEWAKGAPVDLAKLKGKVCVVEFWATWCPPCRTSIHHLTEMQKKYKEKGVVFVGVTSEMPAKVKPFVEKMGEKMDYTVAVDDAGQTNKAYMEAYKIDGIPHAFVIDQKGCIAWNGHPMDGLDGVLEQVLSGSFDIEAARKAEQAKVLAQEYLKAVGAGGEEGEEGGEKAPDPAKLKELGDKVVTWGGRDAGLMNAFAWTLLTDEQIRSRDLALGLRAAKAALDASKGKDAGILDTYARALFENGKATDAAAFEKKALGLCGEGDDETKAQFEEALAKYEKAAASAKP